MLAYRIEACCFVLAAMAGGGALASGELTLQQALARTLQGDPTLASFDSALRALDAEALQSSVRPNPELSFALENIVGSGELNGLRAAETTLQMSQLFEFGGKRMQRLRLARLDRELGRWDYEAARVSALRATAQAFVGVVEAQALAELSSSLVVAARESFRTVSERLRAGASSPAELAQARLEWSTSRADSVLVQRELAIRRQRLAAQWGSEHVDFASASGDLSRIQTPLAPLDSLQLRVARNPELARWTLELDRRRAAIDAARAQRAVNLTVAAGLRHLAEVDDLGLVLEISAPLPLFDRSQGVVGASEERAEQATWNETAASLRIRTEIATLHQALFATSEELVLLRDAALPAAIDALQLSREAYELGRARLTEVLTVQRSYFDLQSRILGAQARFHVALADLNALIGEPLGEMP
jgi:cobalt-zinc-cadmium efflux system outer membrane protein